MKNNFVFLLIILFGLPIEAKEYMSLKYDEVNLRTGPGERFPIDWVYQEQNYPVEILESYEVWRQVREVDGTTGWMNKNMLSQKRYALVREEDSLLQHPRLDSEIMAVLQPGVVAQIEECPKGEYCHLKLNYRDKKYHGWFLRKNLWGIDPNEIID